jgi:uncharacterized protein YdeI (BOF family)
MPSRFRLVAALVLAISAGALAFAQTEATTGTQPKGTTYDATFTFGDTTYSGTMTLTFAKEGAVSGTMAIESPVPVKGNVVGKRDGTKLTFDYPYSMAGDQPCDGRVTIDATIDEKDNASGTAHSVGCSDQPVDGTFSLKRHEEK